MADVIVYANCGCGYRTERLEEAEKHSDSEHHKMVISGAVSRAKNVPSSTRPSEPTQVDTSSIETLRKKFSKTGG